MWLASIPGRELFIKEILSPLILAVIIVTIVPFIAYYFYMKRTGATDRRAARARLGLVIAILTIMVVVGINYYTFKPGTTYGLELSDGKLVFHYYENRVATYNVCKATIKLIDVDTAKHMLKIRTYGTSDPTVGIYAGEYILTNNSRAHVLIVPGASRAIIIEEKGVASAIIGVPNAGEAYNRIVSYREAHCNSIGGG
ncbi:MAG: hypothetical protein LRS48_05025 [Desulfurococcales archaeon]|nr:hypothetical protein [Desulfurococcales archaeon]